MTLATTKVENFDRLLKIFATKAPRSGGSDRLLPLPLGAACFSSAECGQLRQLACNPNRGLRYP